MSDPYITDKEVSKKDKNENKEILQNACSCCTYEVSHSIVTIVLRRRHPGQLNKGKESQDLKQSSRWNSTDTISTERDIRELQVVGWGKVSIEDDVVVVNDNT